MPFFLGSGGNSVTVALDNSICRPGAILSGSAYIDIVTPTNFTGVELKIKGKENVYWVEHQTRHRTVTYTENGQTRTRTESYTVDVPHVGKRQIFKTVAIILPGGTMLQGQFSVPFSFKLPDRIPGSFALSGTDFKCSVEYAAKVVVRIPGLLKTNLRHEVPIVVIQPPPPFTSQVSASSVSDITVMCCFNRGSAELSFQTAKDAFFTGEAVMVLANANNQSKSDLKRLTIKLRRSLTITAGDGRSFFIEQTISEQQYPGLRSFTSVNNLSMNLNIPSNTPQQCFATTIQCLYSVRLAGKVRWGKDATCTVPAFIYHPFIEQPVIPQFAATWQPTVIQPVVLAVQTPVLIPPPISLEMYPEFNTMHASAPPVPSPMVAQASPVIDPSNQASQGYNY
jgi:hypothetical protein